MPIGPRWAARSTAHLWLGKWQERGLLDQVLNLLLEKADTLKSMGVDRIKIDVFFLKDEEVEEEIPLKKRTLNF
jgi:hypothetical protein